MSKATSNNDFFSWVVGLFKKKKPLPVVEVPPTPEELEHEAKWIMTKSKYRLEFMESYNMYFVQYLWKGKEWLYLRRWDDDYAYERVRGNAIRIEKPEQLDLVIRFHEEWIKGGHIFFL